MFTKLQADVWRSSKFEASVYVEKLTPALEYKFFEASSLSSYANRRNLHHEPPKL